jgi:tetratricopeptide (TPR) repeat protein
MREKKYFIGTLILLFLTLLACDSDKKSFADKHSDMDSPDNHLVIDNSISDSSRLVLIEKLVNENQLIAAIKNIDFLLQHSPDNPSFLFMKADALERMKDTSEAINYYQKADQAAGLFLQAKMKLLQLYAETGNPKALSLSDSLYQLPQAEKNQSDILLMKGICLTKLGKFKEAESVFDIVLKIDYTCLQAYLEKGWLYYDQQQYQKALKIFELSTIVKNDFAEGYFWMAKTHQQQKQQEKAILNFKKSLALDPELTEAREELKSLGAIQ